MDALVTPVVEIAKCAGKPLLSIIARPFQPFWGHDENFRELRTKAAELRAKSEELSGCNRAIGTNGERALPPGDVSIWQQDVNNICNEISSLTSERDGMGCNSHFNVKKFYQHRRNVAKKLKEAGRLYLQFTDSKNLWKHNIKIQILKKLLESLKDDSEGVQNQIKDGEEALSDVQNWLDEADTNIRQREELTKPLECSNCHLQLNCSVCYTDRDNLRRKVSQVEDLLQKAMNFTEFSRIKKERKYENDIQNLKEQVETLKLKEEDVRLKIKVGDEPLPSVKKWQDEVKMITDKVSVLIGEYSQKEVVKVTTLLEEANLLLQQETEFKDVSYRPPPASINYQFIIQETLQSRLSISKTITETLQNDEVEMVGIYGMGGVGKTTLAKYVGVCRVQGLILFVFGIHFDT